MTNNGVDKNEIINVLIKILPPLFVAAIVKVTSEYTKKQGKVTFIGTLVILALGGCGAILGYWVSQYFHWTEYKMTLTIFFFGLVSDKLFEFILSKSFINKVFITIENWLKSNLKFILSIDNNNEKKED